ncbi:hypothetical protein DVH24_001808 [Malus domestica]|uniref:t-SNARE coiled-coil homology domain-containing protein n=1 Tax=Malus domestica TaxID=3750 RepID=A0A498I4Z2_MALDO|nr:hypothetical protein DVH24_001808 [Malus domestica]
MLLVELVVLSIVNLITWYICLILNYVCSFCREHRSSKASLLDGLEEGGLRASSSYSHDINEHDNDKSVQSLQDRVVFLKRLTGDIHEEVESHNRLLDRMGNSMDVSRGILSGTMDRFKMVPKLDLLH